MKFNAAYIPIGVPTFHLESAQALFEKSITLLHSIDETVKAPEEMLLSIDKLNAFLDTVQPDYVIVQNVTFANGAYMAEVLRRFSCPVLLWTLREPVIDGTRLRLNSLTGAFSAANMLRSFGRPFTYVFGSPEEEGVQKEIRAAVKAAQLKKALSELKVLQIGHTPQGFGFGRALDAEMMHTFGAELEAIEARELIGAAKSFTEAECIEYLQQTAQATCGLENTPAKNQLDHARLYKAYSDFVKGHGIGALASRC
jgi:L-fucose isomerase-like protein